MSNFWKKDEAPNTITYGPLNGGSPLDACRRIHEPILWLFAICRGRIGSVNRVEKRYARVDDLMDIPATYGFEMTSEELITFLLASPVNGHIISRGFRPDVSFYVKEDEHRILEHKP